EVAGVADRGGGQGGDDNGVGGVALDRFDHLAGELVLRRREGAVAVLLKQLDEHQVRDLVGLVVGGEANDVDGTPLRQSRDGGGGLEAGGRRGARAGGGCPRCRIGGCGRGAGLAVAAGLDRL